MKNDTKNLHLLVDGAQEPTEIELKVNDFSPLARFLRVRNANCCYKALSDKK